MSDSDVSVIIPTYNAGLLLRRCIESISTQTAKPSEIIVVDDGSTDNTQCVLCSLNSKKIKIIVQENKGPAAARNRGLDIATGKYIAFLDADDYWEPRFIEKTARFLEEHPEAIAVSVGQVHKIIGKKPCITPKILSENSNLKEPCVLQNFFEFWAEHNHVCTGSILIRTEIAKRTEGQRPEFRAAEDMEFWWYLATFGKWGFIPEILFASDGASVTQKKGWLNKNKIRWASVPNVEEWQKRIVPRLSEKELNSFKKARAKIASNLAYSMILSGRDKLAREALGYFENYKVGRLGKLMKKASDAGTVTWKVLCYTLIIRELVRDYVMR